MTTEKKDHIKSTNNKRACITTLLQMNETISVCLEHRRKERKKNNLFSTIHVYEYSIIIRT